MFGSLRSPFGGRKERREDPGHFESEPSGSSASKSSTRQFFPSRQRISRNSSRSQREEHLHGNGQGRTETPTDTPGERQPESRKITASRHNSQGSRQWPQGENNDTHGTHDAHTKWIASGQSSSQNVLSERGNSLSPNQVSPLDPGRTYSITEEDEGAQTHRFASADSALRAPMTAGAKSSSAPLPAQKAAELSAETMRHPQVHELHAMHDSYKLQEAPALSSTNLQTHLSEVHPSADMNDTLGQSTFANPELILPVSSSNNIGNVVHTNLTSPTYYTNNAVPIAYSEPLRQVVEQPNDYRPYIGSNNGDQMHRSQLRDSTSTEGENENKLLPYGPSTEFNNSSAASHTGQNGEMPQVTRTVPDQPIRRPEEGFSRTQGQQYPVGLNGHPSREYESPRVPDNTNISRQENDTPTKRTRPPAQGSMNTNSEALHLDARIREAIREYSIPKRPGLDPFSTLLTWVSQELNEKEQIIERQRTDLTTLNQEADPKKKDVKVLRKQVQSLEPYKLKNDELRKENDSAQKKITELTQELNQVKKEKKQARKDFAQSQASIAVLAQEKNDYSYKLKDTESTLASARKELGSAQAGLQQYKKQRDEYMQENGQLRRTIEHLEQEKKKIEKQAGEELLKAAARYQSGMAQLEESHNSKVSELEHKRALELSELEHKMQAIIDEKDVLIEAKDRQIAAQDLRMASYSKPAHGLISDGDFGARLRDLAMKLDNLADAVPKPENSWIPDQTLDPSNFLGRNEARLSRIWHKFVRNVCWSVIIHGFFQRQPGFGAFGDRADGHATLLHLYRLFAPSDTQGKQNRRPSITAC
jgi:hypothetical protein